VSSADSLISLWEVVHTYYAINARVIVI